MFKGRGLESRHACPQLCSLEGPGVLNLHITYFYCKKIFIVENNNVLEGLNPFHEMRKGSSKGGKVKPFSRAL